MARRGRKPRSATEKRLIAAVAAKLQEGIQKGIRQKRFQNTTGAAADLGISRAALYKYTRGKSLPSASVLWKAHRKWIIDFEFEGMRLDRDFFQSERPKAGYPEHMQYALPFIENLRKKDVQLVKVETEKPDSVELTLKIRFAG